MQLSHAMDGIEDAVDAQLRLTSAEAADLGAQLLAALRPAIKDVMLSVVGMAATEISSQLHGQNVEIRLVDGDPELVVVDDASSKPGTTTSDHGEEAEARLTLRLPGYLKELIAEAADDSGDSVNSFVVESLRSSTSRKRGGVTRHQTTIEL